MRNQRKKSPWYLPDETPAPSVRHHKKKVLGMHTKRVSKVFRKNVHRVTVIREGVLRKNH